MSVLDDPSCTQRQVCSLPDYDVRGNDPFLLPLLRPGSFDLKLHRSISSFVFLLFARLIAMTFPILRLLSLY